MGREEALARIAWVVSGARAGHGGALLLSGEPGSGKSALLDAARADADGMTVLRCAGAQDEREFPYAGVHALLRPLQRHWGELVPAQRNALEQALGGLSGEPPAPLLVGAAVLSVLDAAAADAPLLILIDDLQWVDIESREAVGFAARRLADDPVGLLLAARSEGAELPGVDRYDLPSLEPAAALEVLALNGVVRSVAERLSAVGGGNPLALVELATLLDDDQRRGAAPLPDPLPATSPAKVYATAFAALPLPVRLAAATAAIAGNVPAWVLAAALDEVGTDHRRLAVAEPTGLVQCSPRGVTWRHPLARSAAAAAVSPAERRQVHAALADALGGAQVSAPAVVWHRVEASTGPDERLAGAREEVARTAASRGAHLAAAHAFEVASRVGTDPTNVPRRLGEAALAAWAGDDPATAARLIEEALPTVEDPDLRWRLSLTAGQVAQATAAPQQASEAFLRAVDEARAAGRQDREVQALASAFNPALHLDDPERLRWLAGQIAGAADPHDPVQAVRAHAVQGFTLLNADQTEAGRRHLEQALATIAGDRLLRTHPDLLQMTVQAAMWSGSPMRLREAIDETVAPLAAEAAELAAELDGVEYVFPRAAAARRGGDAAPAGAAGRGQTPVARRRERLHRPGCGPVAGANPRGASRLRGDPAQPGRAGRRADRRGGSGGPVRRGRPDQQGDRRHPLPVREDRRVPPGSHLPQAGRPQPLRARTGPRGRRPRLAGQHRRLTRSLPCRGFTRRHQGSPAGPLCVRAHRASTRRSP